MLSSLTNRTAATGSDSTAVYNFNFRIFEAADLLVTVRNLTTNVETVLVLNTDFSVAQAQIGTATGFITLINANQLWLDSSGDLSSNYLINIRRVMALTQSTSIRNSPSFYASVHEDKFDYLTMICQQLQDELSRAVMMAETIIPSTFNPVIPSNLLVSPPAGAVLQVNPTENGWTLGSPALGWQVATINYTQFNAAATQQQITAFQVPAGCIFMGAVLKHNIAFAGTSITDVYCDLGVSSPDQFISDFDVYQAIGDQVYASQFPQNVLSFANATNVKLRATATGANLANLTAGSINVYYWYMNLNGG